MAEVVQPAAGEDFDQLHGIAGRASLEMQDMAAPAHESDKNAFRARSATQLYKNVEEKYILANELKLSNGLPVDYVLVHKINKDKNVQERAEKDARERWAKIQKRKGSNKGNDEDDDDEIGRDASRTMKRLQFEDTLAGLKGASVEQELGKNPELVFTKIHFPFDALASMAESINLNMPLVDEEQKERQEALTVSARVKKGWTSLNKFIKRYDFFDHGLEEEEDYFSAPFVKTNIMKFRNHNDQNRFFTDSQRSTLGFEILNRLQYGMKADQVGIRKLLHNGTYLGAFPLHDGPLPTNDDPTLPENKTTRGLLYQRWARIRSMFRRQPIDTIRKYYGERVGIYFAWLGFYTTWLIFPAFVGFIVFLYGLGTYEQQNDAKDLCSSNKIMCPLCDTCEPWILKDVCLPYKFSWVFDNGATIFFAVFMSIWASVFQDFWRRRNALLAYEWDVRNLTLEEPDRPQFKGQGTKTRKHPVTGAEEKYYPVRLRWIKYFVTFSTVVVAITTVIIIAIGIIVYRLAVAVVAARSSDPSIRTQSTVIASATAAIINLFVITILSMIYSRLAVIMTDWENHRKHSKYEAHLAFKMFVFQFVNTYSSLFYVAFFKGQQTGSPGDYGTFFGYRQECANYGCLLELTIQLAIIMVGKQVIGNVTEFMIPRIMRYINKRRRKGEVQLMPWEEQFALEAWPAMDLFFEYLEMIIQFGFITLFVASFPLSPFFALLNNIWEIRIDADKMITGLRRPPAQRAASIGIWEGVLEFVSFFSVITNGLVIAITSSYLTKLVYQYQYESDLDGFINKTRPYFVDYNCSYSTLLDSDGKKGLFFYEVWASRAGFLIAFEHFVFLAKFAAQAIIPNVPKQIEQKIMREEFLAAKALQKQMDDTDDFLGGEVHDVSLPARILRENSSV